MATATSQHEDHSKRDRILNALTVYPEEEPVSNQAIAEITGASASYVYQLRAAIDEGDLSDDDVEAARDARLRSQYRDRLADLLDVELDGVDGSRSIVDDALAAASADRSNGSVPLEEVVRVRAVMERYREDAAFERDRFEGAGRNIAEEKYFIASRAIELLDEVIER